MSALDPSTPVRDVLRAHPATLLVFERHRVDYCCGGARPIADACERVRADLARVLEELDEAIASGSQPVLSAESMPLDALVEHIVGSHHRTTREAAAVLPALAAKVARVHGEHTPTLVPLARAVGELFAELVPHLEREEQMLFPAIRELVLAQREGRAPHRPPFGTVSRPIHVMHGDHDAAGALLHRIDTLTGGYVVPERACGSWRALYANLASHGADLMRHVWLENEVLFPRAIELEAALLAATTARKAEAAASVRG